MTIEYSLNRYRIVGDVQSSLPLLKLLRQCPSHMQDLTYAEIFDETLRWIFGAFLFLLEPRYGRVESITVADFVAKIKASHDESNPKISYAIAVLEALEPVE